MERTSRNARKKILDLYDKGLGNNSIASAMLGSRFELSDPTRAKHEDKKRVYAALASNGGNVKRTARETSISTTTVRRWKEQFKENPPGEHLTDDSEVSSRQRVLHAWHGVVKQVLAEAGRPSRPGRHQPPGPLFWSQVVEDAKTGCWNWTGVHNGKGYGRFRGMGAHRFAYEEAHGALDGRVIHHTCANRRCVRPAHLLAVADAVAHGRVEHLERALIKHVKSDEGVAELTELRGQTESAT
jgi:transposase-like protein